MKKVTETDKLKYWLDAEISWMHVMLAAVLYKLTTVSWQRTALVVYMVISVIYALVRFAYISSLDKNYLRVPKK